MRCRTFMKKRNKWVLSTVGGLLVLIYLFPVYLMVVSSIKSQTELFDRPPTLWPKNIQFSGYLDVINQGISQDFFNSFLIAFLSMVIVVVLGVPCAYGLARFK